MKHPLPPALGPASDLPSWRMVRALRARRDRDAARRLAELDVVAARRSVSPDDLRRRDVWWDLSSSL